MENATLNLSGTAEISEKDIEDLDANFDIKSVQPIFNFTKSQVFLCSIVYQYFNLSKII